MLATATILVVAAIVTLMLWDHYTAAPWTRDGQVRVQVANIAPQISGQIVAVRAHDNEFVHKGDVLYEVDPFDFQIALASADAQVRERQVSMHVDEAESTRRHELTTLSTSVEEKQQYKGNAEQSAATFAEAVANQSQARINLARTQIRSTVNGYVTNLLMRVGDYATEGRSNIQVIDADSYWVDGYFEETKLAPIRVGDAAEVVLLGYSGSIAGHVESINRGIASSNAASSTQGLPSVDPVYTWVRLAQRIPVRIHIDRIPPGIVLAAGMTATVNVHPTHPLRDRRYDGPGAGVLARISDRFTGSVDR